MRLENDSPSDYQHHLEHCGHASTSRDITTQLFFLDRDELYETVKPYVIRYDVKTCIPPENIKRLLHPVTIKDLRQFKEKLEFIHCGFEVLSIASSMSYEDYEDEDKIQSIHVPEILDRVKENFSADDVHALEHVIRRRHPKWPIATGDSYDYEQPASRAHLGEYLPHCGERT